MIRTTGGIITPASQAGEGEGVGEEETSGRRERDEMRSGRSIAMRNEKGSPTGTDEERKKMR